MKKGFSARGLTRCAAGTMLLAIATSPMSAPAQTNDPGSTDAANDIIVTARKRDETSISVPVVISAVGAAEIDRRAVNGVDLIARLVPGVIIGEGGGTAQGGNIVIRGVSGADTNNFAEQSVSFNIDSVQVARALVRRLGTFDIQQVEVLKGPQTLFYGKNSPGGVISIRSADPGDSFEAKLQAGYEFVGREIRVEGFVSAPLADGLGIRVAGYGSRLRGWTRNEVPDGTPGQPDHNWGPRHREYAGRITLKYDKGGDFNAKLKLNYNRLKSDGPTWNFQLIDCPLGAPAPLSIPVADDCKLDNRSFTADAPPTLTAADPGLGNGKGFQKLVQFLGSYEMNYSPMDDITFTSVSGMYYSKYKNAGNYTSSYPGSTIFFSRFDPLKFKEFSQELRVTSDYDGPLNFMFGGYAQDMRGTVDSLGYFNASAPVRALYYRYRQKGRAYSAFGQMLWKIVPTLELSGGGRYSYERKRLVYSATGGPGLTLVPFVPDSTRLSFNDFSPEITTTWRPSQDLTVFGSYKRGFLSGGFNTGATAIRNNSYQPQTTKGFEAGVKARLLDGALRLNLAAYTYEVKGLQVNVTVSGVISELRNAGSARVKGLEGDFNYDTPIRGLSVNGGLAYTHARYVEYIASCYRGQPAPGCSMRLSPITGQLALSQDLAGGQLVRAPDWSGNVGFLFDQPIGNGLKIGLSGDMTFVSSYYGEPTIKPASRQKAYQLFDATLRVAEADDRWEVALIGRNLTNEYYFVRSADRPFTGTAPGGPAATSVLADTEAVGSRGREVMLRFTTRFGGR